MRRAHRYAAVTGRGEAVLLTASAATVLMVSLLAEVPETVSFGHEVGLVAGGLAFACLGAWIFNYVIVVRPRHQDKERAYEATWEVLNHIAHNARNALLDLNLIAYGWDRGEPESPDDVREFCDLVWCGEQVARSGGALVNPADEIRWRIELHQQQMRALAPFHHLFDGPVAAALIRLQLSQFLPPLLSIERNAEVIDVHIPRPGGGTEVKATRKTLQWGGHSSYMAEWVRLSDDLRVAMQTVRPGGPIGGGVLTLLSVNSSWELSDERNPADRVRQSDGEPEVPRSAPFTHFLT